MMKPWGYLCSLAIVMAFTSCMTVDGSHSYRKKNKCCGVIKCDMHRRANMRKHKAVTNGKRSVKRQERKIKRGY